MQCVLNNRIESFVWLLLLLLLPVSSSLVATSLALGNGIQLGTGFPVPLQKETMPATMIHLKADHITTQCNQDRAYCAVQLRIRFK